VFISIAWRRRRRRSSSSFEPVHFVGSRLGTTFAFSFLVVMLLGVVEEGRGIVEFPTTGLLLWGGRHWPW
jgi:hypothetical protein